MLKLTCSVASAPPDRFAPGVLVEAADQSGDDEKLKQTPSDALGVTADGTADPWHQALQPRRTSLGEDNHRGVWAFLHLPPAKQSGSMAAACRLTGLLLSLLWLQAALPCSAAPAQEPAAVMVEPPPGLQLSDDEFAVFVEEAAECADNPVPHLLYRTVKNVEERLSTLYVEAKWLTTRERSINDITVCTNCNFERLHMLEAQCKSWGGPVSAVIYLPLELFNPENPVILERAKAQLKDMHARLEASGACAMDLVLVTQLLQEDQMWAYPYNSVRNQAIARSRTKLVVLLDVDFLLRKGLREHLLEPSNWEALLYDTYVNRDVVVLPAFETKPRAPLEEGLGYAMKAFAAGSKEELKEMFDAGEIVQFAPFYPRGHGATNYSLWFDSTRPYPVAFVPGFEPFVMMSRLHVPWYDERFKGYGWDKITQIYQMDILGYNLVVHPHGYVIHRPHPPSAGYNHTFTGPAYTNKHKPTQFLKRMDKVAKEMMKEVRWGVYPPYGVTALAGCRRLDVFKEGREGLAPSAGGEGLPFSKAEAAKLRIQDPVQGWW